ncbi:hypothetical protein HYH03_003170 [Edaphochlamys debaryana]|uniref:Uncharacterized protein n=1 Tax=Edaphochlamys debaryana TaxID=47281 RepID=A0A836C4P3_9CHLO|nr:hypothetical protein HYH03_003170 [Edaphochlamys debaryana]|eukprot:KAG2498984.1 hypothetical protein HYH03_003170 [Edaphochlamys debaryana]
MVAFGSLLSVMDVSLAVELAYCAWAAVATVLLAWWYQDYVPGGVSIPWQLATRLLVAGVNTYLHRAICLPRRRRQAEAAARAAAAVARGSASAAGCAKATICCNASCDEPPTADALEEPWTAVVDSTSSALGEATAGGLGSDECSSSSDCGTPQREPVNQAMAADMSIDGSSSARGSSNTIDPSPDAAQRLRMLPYARRVWFVPGLNPASGGSDGASPWLSLGQGDLGRHACLAPVSVRPLYRSCLQRSSAMIKIPWAEPFQVRPNLQLLLREAVTANGLASLAAATVEHGCIKLTLVIEELAEGAKSGAGAGFPSPARVLEALGVGPGPEGHAEPVWSNLLTLTPAQPDLLAGSLASRPHLAPRVLMVPPPSANSAGSPAEGVRVAAALPRLRLALTMPEGLAGGEVEVQVALRSKAGLLASRLVPVSSGGSTAAVLRE